MGGNFKINIINKTRFSRKIGEQVEINFGEIARLTGCNFKFSSGSNKLFESNRNKIFIIVQFDADRGIIRDRFKMAQDLINRRSAFKNELALELVPPAHYDISKWLVFLMSTFDPILNKKVFLSFNLTKGGMYVLYLNDVTDEKKIEAVREGKIVKGDEDVASRVFITCPIAFMNLRSEYITLDWMQKLTGKDHFVWNGKIYKKVPKHFDNQENS